ncbi:hypothetical protein EZV62_016538 [Acer yangbiense]|uniref:glutathione transferase n=1 Tax=Acer yangbiense TaxID=1000413 RepID=A0A5C7HPF3_9ROSI|nr:hypothetical protein EZV62_016538 [Acer yangbiense]
MAEEVKLFGFWASPFSRRVEIALKIKGVKYEYIEEDLNNKSPLLLKYNPVHKKIPVLVHNGNAIAESLVIIEYIDETWKHNPILPQHPYDRALARFWAKFIDEKAVPALRNFTWGKGKEREVAIGEACEHLKTLENELGDKKFFGGEDIGLVDIVANVVGIWFGVCQELSGLELLTEEKFPKLCKWIHEYVNHTAIKEDVPPRDKLIEFYSARFEAASK